MATVPATSLNFTAIKQLNTIVPGGTNLGQRLVQTVLGSGGPLGQFVEREGIRIGARRRLN